MEITGGSLGHGLAIAVGMSLGIKRKRSDSFVYTLFSDGELDEGSVWEAAMSAGSYKLDNLIGIVDVNNMQADGPSTHRDGLRAARPQNSRPSAGWSSVSTATTSMPSSAPSTGRVNRRIQAPPHHLRHQMAKGVPFLEARERNHFLRVEPDEWGEALRVLDAEKPS